MKYSVEPWIFEKIPNVQFGIIIAKGLKNTDTAPEDSAKLSEKEALLRTQLDAENLKTYPQIALYRDALQSVGINPNKFMNSVEAMSKRILKGGDLPRINALVDLCNAVSVGELISLGAHDLRDIDADLAVRLSQEGDCFLPFGETEFEAVPSGELVFTSGSKIQTRQWLWRQSELGKITGESSDIFFQLVGFEGAYHDHLKNALSSVEALIHERFGGTFESFIVNKDQNEIHFER